MKILAIESSCDETAAAVVENGTTILSNVVISQIDIFATYGGVIPEVAARSHLEAILPVVHQALHDAHLTPDDLDAIAVTHTPGLLGSLLIGTLTARTLAILWHKPLYAVHHLKSHIYANWLTPANKSRSSTILNYNHDKSEKGEEGSEAQDSDLLFSRSSGGSAEAKRHDPVTTGAMDAGREKTVNPNLRLIPKFPLLALVISGGHTQIIYMPAHNQFEIIGTTRDDAVGECFDKVAKILGLPYPGGPSIAKCAQNGNPEAYKLPHPQVPDLDFSFSGLKTAVLRAVQQACTLPITTPSYELQSHLSAAQKADFAASFQSTACDILIDKLKMALRTHPDAQSIVLAGGVSANQVLRQKASAIFSALHKPIFFPDPKFTGDNAAMVGAAAYYEIKSGIQPTDPYQLNIAPRTPIQ